MRNMHRFLIVDLIALMAPINDLPLSRSFPSKFVVSSHSVLTHVIYFGQWNNSRLDVNEGLKNVCATKKYHYTSIKFSKIQNTDNTKCCRGCGVTGTLIHCWGECKMEWPLWTIVFQFLMKLNILLPGDLAIILLSIYPK